MSEHFKKNIGKYEALEAEMTAWLTQQWNGKARPKKEGYFPAYDAMIFFPVTFEYKCDEQAAQTGNLFLEVHNPRQNKPSGLEATEAFWWFCYIKGENLSLMFEPRQMLTYLKQSQHRLVPLAGDNNSRGYLLPLTVAKSLDWVKKYKTTFKLPS